MNEVYVMAKIFRRMKSKETIGVDVCFKIQKF